MTWYYAKDKAKVGPIDEAELTQLLQSGAITSDTLVWTEGMPGWQPYSVVRPSASPLAPTGSPATCVECGQTFPPEQLITLAGRRVCAACKPLAVQKLQEGVVSFGQPVDAEELWQTIQQRGFNFTIGSVISLSWKLLLGNFWPCLGVTLLCNLIMMGANQIPFLGVLALFLVQPQMMAGLSWYFLKQFRGEGATLNDAFAGFRRGYGQQALYMLIVFGIVIGFVLVCGIPLAIIIPALSSAAKAGSSQAWMAVPIITITLAAFFFWYLMLCWIFTSILILDKGLTAPAAMKLSRRVVHLRIWKILGFCFVIGLLFLLGFLALIVGLLFMLPLVCASFTRLYEDAFGKEGR